MAETYRTPELEDKFLCELATSCCVSRAAKSAGVPRRTVYEWRDQSEEFRAAWDDAIKEGVDSLKYAARLRALDHSDALMMFLIKYHDPDYRENQPQRSLSTMEAARDIVQAVKEIEAATAGD